MLSIKKEENDFKIYTFSSGLIDLTNDWLADDEYINKIIIKGQDNPLRGLIGTSTIIEIYLDGNLDKSVGLANDQIIEIEISSKKNISILIRQGKLTSNQLTLETSKI